MIPFKIFFPLYAEIPFNLKKKAAQHVGFKHAYYFSKKRFLTPKQFEDLNIFIKNNTEKSDNTIKEYVEDDEHKRQYYKVLCDLISSNAFQLQYTTQMKHQVIDEQKNIYKQLN